MFDLEPEIIARLRAIDGFRTVDSSSLIDGSGTFTELMPAALVRPSGADVDLEASTYGELVVKQTWAILVVVQHTKLRAGIESAAMKAGELCLEVVRALNYWQPGEPYHSVSYSGTSDQVLETGWAAYELRFTVSVKFSQ